MTESMSEITKMLPTNDELRAIIEKIATFLKAIVSLFTQISDGLKETFSKYVPVYEDAAPAAEEEE
jgi:hypothetical protein